VYSVARNFIMVDIPRLENLFKDLVKKKQYLFAIWATIDEDVTTNSSG